MFSLLLGVINGLFLTLFLFVTIFGSISSILKLDFTMIFPAIFFACLAFGNLFLAKSFLKFQILSWKLFIFGILYPIFEVFVLFLILNSIVLGLMNIG